MIRVDAQKAQAQVAKVDAKLRALVEEIGARWQCKIAMPNAEATRFARFTKGGPHQPARPVFLITPDAARIIMDEIRQRFNADLHAGTVRMLPAITVGMYALRRIAVERLNSEGGDTPFRALSPRYAARKRLGRGPKGARIDPRIGIASGDMLDAVASGQIVVFKR